MKSTTQFCYSGLASPLKGKQQSALVSPSLSRAHLAQVIDAYTRMLKAKKGEIDAIVTTAEPLTPQQEKALAAGLKAQVVFFFFCLPCLERFVCMA